MPRIRTLKPEHRQHRKVGPLSHVAYRLWVGMILEADDYGRLVCDAEQLRVLMFGYHPKTTTALVERAIGELVASGLVRLYTLDGRRYADFPSWGDHQRIDRIQPSKLPMYEHSSNGARTLVTDLDLDLEGKGKESKGMDVGQVPDVASLERCAAQQRSTDAKGLLQYLNHKAGRNYQPGDANIGFISARLKEGATVGQCRAIIGLKCAKWKGDPKMDTYLRPATLFNKEKFEQYLGELPATAFEATLDA